MSYAGLEEVGMMAMDVTGIRRIYSLVQLSPSGDSFKVDNVRSVPYQSVSYSAVCLLLPPLYRLPYRPPLPVLLCTLEYNLSLKDSLSASNSEMLSCSVLEVSMIWNR